MSAADGIVGILTGRKTGKSTGLAYILICLMLCVRKETARASSLTAQISSFKAIVSSKTLEQAKIILSCVKSLISRHPLFREGGYTIVESRATCVSIRGPDGTIRVLDARCGMLLC